jgi:uncharacterized protein
MSRNPDLVWSPDNVGYWQAARAGHLLVKQCRACGKPHYYPRACCPFCASPDTEWITASGLGEIYSFSIVRRADPPYITAYVTLLEGVTMLTNIVDCDPNQLRIGQAVRVVFRPVADGRCAPMFVPIE